MNIIIFGPQGSGKGTQAKLLAKKFNLFYFESGKFLREIAKKDPEIDKTINEKGKLLPDDKVFSLVSRSLEEKVPDFQNIVLDGYPRSIKQYELLADWLKKKGSKINRAIFLDISEKESIKRLSARRMDPKTGKIYNLLTAPKPGPSVNKKDLVQREDDKPAAIKERLASYHKTTEPLVSLLEKEGILTRVDGERPIDEIHRNLVDLVRKIK